MEIPDRGNHNEEWRPGAVIGVLNFANDGKEGASVSAGDKDLLTWISKLPSRLVITSEAQGYPRAYIQFIIWCTELEDIA